MKKQIYIAFALTLFTASFLGPILGWWIIALAGLLLIAMILAQIFTPPES